MKVHYNELSANVAEGVIDAPEYNFSYRTQGAPSQVLFMLEHMADLLENTRTHSPSLCAVAESPFIESGDPA